MPTIEFHTYNRETIKNFKPILASKVIPDWWKQMKAAQYVSEAKQHTIRVCPAMQDWLTMGYYLVANRDLVVICGKGKDDNDSVKYTVNDEKDSEYNSATHPNIQFGNVFNFMGEGNGPIRDAFKMKNPWNIKTPDGYSCFYLDPFLHQNKFFSTWPGIIDTDRFNKNEDNSQIIFYPKVDYSFVIKEGTPLVQIIPFRREEWVSSLQLRDKKSYFDNLSEITNPDKDVDKQGMAQHKRDNPDNDKFKAGPYRSLGYWKDKTKMFGDVKECPFHQKEEESSETQLEFDFDGS
jgi:hypothetical protein